MSDHTAGPHDGHRRRPQRLALAAAVLLILALAMWGCDGEAEEGEDAVDAEVAAPPSPPAIPQPEASVDDPADVDLPMPPTPRPRAGAVVLLHLEGPVTDADATDVVVRNERGTELDRFRLAGAVDVYAGSASAWALIVTRAGQWARYDAISGELTLLTFDGDPPREAPRVQGSLAWWDEPDRPWLVRLDTGTTRSLRDQMVEGGRVVAATPSGGHLLVASDGDHVIDTSDGAVRTLPPQSSVTLSADGTRIASTAPAPAGADVYLEGIDGSDRRLIATVPDDGLLVPLEDGRVLVLGTASRIIQTDGTLIDLPSVPGAAQPVVAADGRRVMVVGEAGLVLVDPDAETAVALEDSRGLSVYAQGPRTVLWAVSEDPTQPGALAVDPVYGDVLSLLPDTPTGPFTAVSEDGRTVMLQAGEDGADRVILTAEGDTWTATDVTDAALHPDASLVAMAVISEVMRSLLVGAPDVVADADQVDIEVPTGRNPVWLKTAD